MAGNLSTKPHPAGLAHLLTVSLAEEQGVVAARRRAKQIAGLLGFDQQDQIRIATATSEIARNAVQYGREGRVEFLADLNSEPSRLMVRVSDKGPGMIDSEAVLDGRQRSQTGMGLGLIGTRRLMDHFVLESKVGAGITVFFGKNLPRDAKKLNARRISALCEDLAKEDLSPAEETRQHNQELLLALELVNKQQAELEKRQNDKLRLEQELEETNRGVVALYAELDERASALRQATDIKTRFLSYVSHEFRTPLNAVLALVDLLLRRVDGDLTSEQERQIKFVRTSSTELLEMVNDLLDIAKVEAGKVDLRLGPVQVTKVFSALRGMMRPLIQNDHVNLVFEDPPALSSVFSDEGKINQILRNLISNALKFTERGEVRVSAACQSSEIVFAVSDSGIGIAPDHLEAIFREFSQVESPMQRKVRGTGLGLPLSRKLAELLGGSLTVESSLGIGSTFRLTIPRSIGELAESLSPVGISDSAATSLTHVSEAPEKLGETILVIDDDEVSRYLVQKLLRGTPYTVTEAANGIEGFERARFERPSLILLDIYMPDRNGFDILDDLKSDPATCDIPVILHTSSTLTAADLVRVNGRHVGILPKKLADQGHARAMILELVKPNGASEI